MDNGIHIRQNEEKGIAMLAAQRQLYIDVKVYTYAIFVLSVLIPFLCSVLMLFIKDNLNLEIISYIVSLFSLVFSLLINKSETDKKELAAFIQMKFDVFVFAMPWKTNLFPTDRNVLFEIDKYSEKLFKREPDQRKKLCNWYDRAEEIKSVPLLEAIYSCQHENLTWDYELRRRVKTGGTILSFFLIILIFTFGALSKSSIAQVICRFAFIIPILHWTVDLNKKMANDMNRLDNLRNRFNPGPSKTMEDLQIIEYDFYNHRKQCYLIPDLIYSIFRNHDSEREHRISDL